MKAHNAVCIESWYCGGAKTIPAVSKLMNERALNVLEEERRDK